MQYGTINGSAGLIPQAEPRGIYRTSQQNDFLRYLLTCCGLFDQAATRSAIKPRKIPMKIEPKVFLANERTLLTWIHMAVWLGSISALLLSKCN